MPTTFDPYSPYYPRVRFGLTGNTTKGPKDGELTFLVEEVVGELTVSEPRIMIDAQGNTNLASGDLSAWQTWVALETAARYVESPAAQNSEMMLTQVKYGDQSKTFRSLGPEVVAASLRERAARARLRISIIRNRIAASNRAQSATGSGTASLAGRRRVLGQPHTLQGLARQTANEK